MAYYDGTKLLSLKDANGENPEIYMVSGNRTAGKTTYFRRLLDNSFKKGKGKFVSLYRFDYQLKNAEEAFFKDMNDIFFPNDTFAAEPHAKGKYYEWYINDQPCGYALAINNADFIKENSSLFNDVERILFDEFQSETNKYCADEIRKFRSVHTSIARGKGKQVRYVPVYMCSNMVTVLNPYFTAMGISSRIRKNTKFLRGNGFVLEQAFNESASKAQMDSGFNKAFVDESYLAYSAQNIYLNDNYSFIEQPSGRGRYMYTVKYLGKHYSIWSYDNEGILYVSDKADLSFPNKLSLSTDDHNINYLMLKNNSFTVLTLRDLFNRGCFRFKNLECKEMLFTLLSY